MDSAPAIRSSALNSLNQLSAYACNFGIREAALEFRQPEGIRNAVGVQRSDEFIAGGTHGRIPGSRQSTIGAVGNESNVGVPASDPRRIIPGAVIDHQYFVRGKGLSEKALNRRRQKITDIVCGNVDRDLRHAELFHLPQVKRYQTPVLNEPQNNWQ